MDKPIVDKQRMLSHVINDGFYIRGDDGCMCIKGAFLDAVCNLPTVPGVRSKPSPIGTAYRYFLGDCRDGPDRKNVWNQQFPELSHLLDKYENRLNMMTYTGSQMERQELLSNCVAELEEHDLVEWKTEASRTSYGDALAEPTRSLIKEI